MSSSGFHPPPHLHRVAVHSHGKRPFEECGGYDSDPDSSMPIHPAVASGTSSTSNSHRFTPSTPQTGLRNPEARNKRARSTSSTSTDDSTPSSSSGYNTAQSSSRSDVSSDGPSALPANPVDCPARPLASPLPLSATQDVHMSDLHLPIPPTLPQRTHVPSPPTPEDTLRTSLQRFAEFDRQIAALRTSLAGTRSPPLPPLGPSVDGDPRPSNDQWHPTSSNFISSGGSTLSSPTPTGSTASTVAVAPSQTLDSLSTFTSSNDIANVPVTASTASASLPSASFLPTYSNVPRYAPPPRPSYPSSTGGSSSHAMLEYVVDPAPSSSTSAFMRTAGGESSGSSFDSHIRRGRRSMSPLVFSSDPLSSTPSVDIDDVLFRYHPAYGDRDPDNGRPHRRSVESPIPVLTHETSDPQNHLGEHSRLPSQTRLGDHIRVIREHSVERDPVRSVFDVFDIGESSQDRNRPSRVRENTTSRYPSIAADPVPPRVLGSHDERSRDPAPTTSALNANQAPQDVHTRLHSSWSSIPSSNSLMSESASERRHALAMERFRARLRRSSFDGDDESDSRRSGSSRGERENGHDLGILSPVPPSPSVESVPGTTTSSHFPPLSAMHPPPSTTTRMASSAMPSLQRSFSEFLAETQTPGREGRTDDWLFDWDTTVEERGQQVDRERQRERLWEWERERGRQREQSSQDTQGGGFPSGSSVVSTSSAREESSYPPVSTSSTLPRPSSGQLGAGLNTTTPNLAATTSNNQQYSYSNLNLSSFQSGLFRDSLRRNAEGDQTSLASNGPVPPFVIPGESRGTSGLSFEDSGSDMDLDDFVEQRLRYAGHTPPPDYTPPPRNTNPLPSFSVLRRVGHESQGRSHDSNRNSMTFTRPAAPVPPRPVRPTSYENNIRPAPPERTERDRFLPARILESLYRSNEDGRRNVSTGNRQPYHPPHPPHQNHSLTPGSNDRSPRSASGNGNGARPVTEVVGENRRSSLGLGGSLRSRLARFANSQSSSNAVDSSSTSRQRSPPHPIGARPQVVERHRRGSSSAFGNTNVFEHETHARSVSGPPPHWAVNPGAPEPPVVTRDAPWRTSSGPRNAFTPPTPVSGSARAEVSDTTNEQRSRLRTLRQRLQLDRGGEGVRVFRPGVLRAAIGRRGNLGDYVPDELFDDSYEALLSLSSMLGEVRSKATPEDVITSLPTGTFKEWKRADSETRCPICLDDYEASDIVTKLVECTHWLHKNCLEQWLRTANTCPVCREKVQASPKPAPARRRPHRDLPQTSHSTTTSGNGMSGRSPQTNPQSNNGRPVSFAAMVFDRLMNDGRDLIAESGSSSSTSHVSPSPTRDPRSAFLERLRAQQQRQQPRESQQPQQPQMYDHHDVYIPFPPPNDLAYRHRVPPTNQGGPPPSRPTAGSGPRGPDESGARPFGFTSLLRGHGPDASTSLSSNMVVDEVGSRPEASGHRPTTGGASRSGSGSGPSFLDPPANQRRDNMFSFVPPPSGTFTSAGGPATASLDTRGHGNAPTSVNPDSSEPPRDWRNRRMYDALFSVEPSRSSSSSSLISFASSISESRPVGMADRIPVEEDSLFEEYVFGWSVRRGRAGNTYPFEGEPTRRGSGEGASSGV